MVTNPSLPNADSPLCSNGFVDHSLLQSIVTTADRGIILEDGTQSILPNTTFLCNGTITKWIIAATWNGDYVLLPQLQLWRRNNSGNSSQSYFKVSSTAVTAEIRRRSHIYEFIVNPPLPFLAGDILGVYSPPCFQSSCGRLRIIHESSSGHTVYFQNVTSSMETFQMTGRMILQHDSRPLVRVEIGKFLNKK